MIIPVLLDPGADPEATFADHSWLVPSSHRSDDIARGIFEAMHLAPDSGGPDNRVPDAFETELHSESVAQVRAAIAGTQVSPPSRGRCRREFWRSSTSPW